MCGISGIYNPGQDPVSPDAVRNMLQQIQYRGPDESGIYMGQGVGLGSVRLSIIDLAQGQQPMSDEAEEMWIVFNGEIFNYIELKAELIDLGYRFRTGSDTEVLLILYKHYREKCLEKLNGQFAFAIWTMMPSTGTPLLLIVPDIVCLVSWSYERYSYRTFVPFVLLKTNLTIPMSLAKMK